jgi:phage tail P2-like protein
MSYPTVLPPASTPLERALEQAAAGVLDMPTPVRDVWSAWNCPESHLPWLAWGLAITHWQTGWTLQRKREAVADAIPYHRRKGTRSSVEEILGRYHPALQLVEWWQATPSRPPHTFEVRAPYAIGAEFLTVETTDAIVSDIAAAKPLRSHFDFVLVTEALAQAMVPAGAQVGTMWRTRHAAIHDTSRDWSAVLQTENGEPIYLPDGTDVLETSL